MLCKVSYPKRFFWIFDDPWIEEVFIVSVDGIHCRIQEPQLEPSSKWYSKKSNRARLVYEISMALCTLSFYCQAISQQVLSPILRQCSLDCWVPLSSALINSNRVSHLRISMKHAFVQYRTITSFPHHRAYLPQIRCAVARWGQLVSSRFLFNLDNVRCSHCRQINVNQRTATSNQ